MKISPLNNFLLVKETEGPTYYHMENCRVFPDDYITGEVLATPNRETVEYLGINVAFPCALSIPLTINENNGFYGYRLVKVEDLVAQWQD